MVLSWYTPYVQRRAPQRPLFRPRPPRFEPGEEELEEPLDGLDEPLPLRWLLEPEESEEDPDPDEPGPALFSGPPRK